MEVTVLVGDGVHEVGVGVPGVLGIGFDRGQSQRSAVVRTHRAADLQAWPQLEAEFVVARLELDLPRRVPELPVGDLDRGRARVDVHLRSAAAVRPSVATWQELAGGPGPDLRMGHRFSRFRRDDHRQSVPCLQQKLDLALDARSQLDLVELRTLRPRRRRCRPGAGHEALETEPALRVRRTARKHVLGVPQLRIRAAQEVTFDLERYENGGDAVAAVVQHSAGDRSADLEFEKDGFVVARADARASEHRVARCPYAEVHEVGGEAFDSETTVDIGSRRSGRSPGSAVLPDGLDRGVGYRSSIGVGDDSVDHGADDQGEIADLEVRFAGRHGDPRCWSLGIRGVPDIDFVLARGGGGEYEDALGVRRSRRGGAVPQ